MDLCFLCIFGYPKFIPGSVEALLGLWGHCWIPEWILALELENKKGFGVASHGIEAPVAPSPLASPCCGVSAQSPGQALEVFPVVPVASGCTSGGF